MSTCSSQIYGWLSIGIATMAFGIMPVAVSRYRAYVKNSAIFNGLRALFALPVAIALVAGFYGQPSIESIVNALPYALLISLGPLIGDTLYVVSIKILGGSLAVIIAYTYIFFVQPIAEFLGEGVSAATIAGSVVAFAGIVIALGKEAKADRKAFSKGVASAIGAALAWGIAVPLIRYSLAYVELPILLLLRLLIIWAVLAPPTPSIIKYLTDINMIKALLISGTFVWGIGMTLYMYSVGCIGSVATAIGTAPVPLLSSIFTRLWIKDKIALRVYVGAALVSMGILITLLS